VARLLGINDIGLRNIVTEISGVQTQWTVNTQLGAIVFKIENNTVDLKNKWDWAQQNMTNFGTYKIDKLGANYFIYLIKDNKKIARVEAKFKTFELALAYFNLLLQALNETFENFYALEHVLLRPFLKTQKDTDLLPVCLQDDCKDEANNDPYSFKATIVLPGYLSRFRNITFRKYAEQIFRQEAPAHVLLKICWVNVSDMTTFQLAYKNWLENYSNFRVKFCAKTLKPLDESAFLLHHKGMIDALNELNTMYPEGNLFDCHLSETSNPILLGNSALGTL
jgi:hypothetical protein